MVHFKVRAVSSALVSLFDAGSSSDAESALGKVMSDITILLSSISLQAHQRLTVMELFGPRGPCLTRLGCRPGQGRGA